MKTKNVIDVHEWIYKHPHEITSLNWNVTIYVKGNSNLHKKIYYSLQISVREFHNDLILLIYQDGFYGAYYKEYNMCIGDTSSRK